MRKLERAGVIAFVCAVACITAWWAYGAPFRGEAQAGAAVKIVLENGHGSGVHVGNGLIVTAAHVVKDEKRISIRDDHGRVWAVPTEVLWLNEKYDVALIRMRVDDTLGVAPLACRTPKVGEDVKLVGSPFEIDFVRTWGRVASGAGRVDVWGFAVHVDITGGPGVSGGPVYDAAGKVIGIAVGGPRVRAPLRSLLIVVPSSTICALMGRT